MSYDAEKAPSPEEWNELEEDEKVIWIVEYHKHSDQEEPEGGWELHSLLHCIVENQIVLEVSNVPATIKKLQRQGLCRHDAVHAVGCIIGEDMHAMLNNQAEFDPRKYRRRLDKLTAKRWLKGKW